MPEQAPANAREVVEKTDQELVELIYQHWNAREIINTAQAELLRRQTEAIKKFNQSSEELIKRQIEAVDRFNKSSTRLGWIMIFLTVAIGLMTAAQMLRR